MTSPSSKSSSGPAPRWTREQIRAARLIPLVPLLQQRGLALRQRDAGNFELATHPGINGLAFTGTTAVGQALMRQFATLGPRPCLAAMSGNNPVLVMPTANLEDAAEGIVRSAFAANGQHCGGCSRVKRRSVH